MMVWVSNWRKRKGKDLTQSYDKSPYTHRKFQKSIVTTLTLFWYFFPSFSVEPYDGLSIELTEEKRKRSDSVLWQKPLHPQKTPKSIVTTLTLFWYFFLSFSVEPYDALSIELTEEKRKISDSVLWQKPLHPQKIQKKYRDNIKTPPKTSITQRLRADLGQSVGVTSVNQTGVVKPVYERSTFLVTETAV